MKIFIGADHRGFEARKAVKAYLISAGYDVEDDSAATLNPDDDYPTFAYKVVVKMHASKDKEPRGILICGSGQGMCMAANRFKGIRAALGYDEKTIRSARNDDDANVLCLPAELIEAGSFEDLVHTFLMTPFAAAPRFIRRIQEMDEF